MPIKTFPHPVIYGGVLYKANTPIDIRKEEGQVALVELAGVTEKPKRAPRKKKEKEA